MKLPLITLIALFVASCATPADPIDLAPLLAEIDRATGEVSGAAGAALSTLDEVAAQIAAADKDGDGALDMWEQIGAALGAAGAAAFGLNVYRNKTATKRYAAKIGEAQALADASKG